MNIPGIRNVAEVQWFWTQEEIPDLVLKRCSKKFGPVESNEVFLNVGRNVQREIDPETVLCRCNVLHLFINLLSLNFDNGVVYLNVF